MNNDGAESPASTDLDDFLTLGKKLSEKKFWLFHVKHAKRK
jgi:hypothetical protein